MYSYDKSIKILHIIQRVQNIEFDLEMIVVVTKNILSFVILIDISILHYYVCLYNVYITYLWLTIVLLFVIYLKIVNVTTIYKNLNSYI